MCSGKNWAKPSLVLLKGLHNIINAGLKVILKKKNLEQQAFFKIFFSWSKSKVDLVVVQASGCGKPDYQHTCIYNLSVVLGVSECVKMDRIIHKNCLKCLHEYI